MLSRAWALGARLRVYFAEMYPLPRRAALAILLGAGFTRALLRAHGQAFEPLSAGALRAAAAVFTLMLMLRLMDELKDLDVDRRLFPQRPVPAGRVRPADVAGCLAATVLAWIGLHAGAGRAALSAACVLSYAGLAFRWFFVPGYLRPRLPATLATHTPLVPLLLLHLTVLADATSPGAAEWRAARVVALVLQFWSAVLAWEIARKIRSPDEENEYVTYSRLWGRAGAVAVACGAQTVSVACGATLCWGAGLAWSAALVPLAGLTVCGHAYWRFLRAPNPTASSRLRPVAETFTASTCVFGLLA